MDNLYSNYAYDLCTILCERARDAKSDKEREPNDYNVARLMAYHEVVSILRDQAIAFGIELEKLGLNNIQPDIDLL
jgi:hypothetical protein